MTEFRDLLINIEVEEEYGISLWTSKGLISDKSNYRLWTKPLMY